MELQLASPLPVKMETPAPHPQEEIAMFVVLLSPILSTIIATTYPTFVLDQIRSISDLSINETSPSMMKWSHGSAAIAEP
jgi:hypothetical protein